MMVEVRKNIDKLYYLKIRYGRTNPKTFVRIYKKSKKGVPGSKMYCSARWTALLFENPGDAFDLMYKYNSIWLENTGIYEYEKHTPEYIKQNYILEEVEVKGVKCYRFVRKEK